MNARTKRLTAIVLALAALTAAGCGGDDETTTTSIPDIGATGGTGPTGATGTTGAQGEPLDFEEARTNLEEAGFNVEDQAGDDLVQETAEGTIEATSGYRVFESGSPADVVIQQYDSPEDAEAVADSLEQGFFSVETRDDVVLFAVKDQEDLLDEVSSAASGSE